MNVKIKEVNIRERKIVGIVGKVAKKNNSVSIGVGIVRFVAHYRYSAYGLF
ncbi:MAG: hypothetical protein JXB29_02635 [Sedimentisphaerales bacterium]|nr:hypothetical protein [Sedimentisphaerales bacterium]